MSLLGSLKEFAKGAGKERNESVLGIDIGSASMKVVQLKKIEEKTVLETYGELQLGPLVGKAPGESVRVAPDVISKALRSLMTQANVTTFNVGVALPFSSSLVTVLSLPPLQNDEQLASLIPIEARKYIPVPIAEVYLDWQKISIAGEGEEKRDDKALLFAIHKKAIDAYQAIISAAELDATFYELEIFSTLRSSVGVSDEPIILADIGAGYAKLYVALQGQIVATRKINTGGSDVTRAISNAFSLPFEKAEDLKRAFSLTKDPNGKIGDEIHGFYRRIIEEIEKLRSTHKNMYKKDVSRVLLSGGASLIDGLPAYASNILSVPVELTKPWVGIETPAFMDRLLSETGPEFGVALGIAERKLAARE